MKFGLRRWVSLIARSIIVSTTSSLSKTSTMGRRSKYSSVTRLLATMDSSIPEGLARKSFPQIGLKCSS